MELLCAHCATPIQDSGEHIEGREGCYHCGPKPCWCEIENESGGDVSQEYCPKHGISASLQRENNYWRRVGGHD